MDSLDQIAKWRPFILTRTLREAEWLAHDLWLIEGDWEYLETRWGLDGYLEPVILVTEDWRASRMGNQEWVGIEQAMKMAGARLVRIPNRNYCTITEWFDLVAKEVHALRERLAASAS